MEKGAGRYFEGCGEEGPLLSVFLCEFHSTYGPKISCQVPEGFISKEKFESVNVYLIPKPQLIRSIVTVTLDDIKIVGYPVRIEKEKYPRNAFYYNVCLVCHSWATSSQYDSALKDLSNYLRELEEDQSLLSGGDVSRVTAILDHLLHSLNTHRSVTLSEGKREVKLRVGRRGLGGLPPPHSVPVLLGPVQPSSRHSLADAVLASVDGEKCLHRLTVALQSSASQTSPVSLDSVREAVATLQSEGAVGLIEELSCDDLLTATPALRSLLTDRHLALLCVTYVSTHPRPTSPTEEGGASVRDLFRLYSSFCRGATLSDLQLRFDFAQMRVDGIKLVRFGLLHRLLRKLHRYPVQSGIQEGEKERCC